MSLCGEVLRSCVHTLLFLVLFATVLLLTTGIYAPLFHKSGTGDEPFAGQGVLFLYQVNEALDDIFLKCLNITLTSDNFVCRVPDMANRTSSMVEDNYRLFAVDFGVLLRDLCYSLGLAAVAFLSFLLQQFFPILRMRGVVCCFSKLLLSTVVVVPVLVSAAFCFHALYMARLVGDRDLSEYVEDCDYFKNGCVSGYLTNMGFELSLGYYAVVSAIACHFVSLLLFSLSHCCHSDSISFTDRPYLEGSASEVVPLTQSYENDILTTTTPLFLAPQRSRPLRQAPLMSRDSPEPKPTNGSPPPPVSRDSEALV